MSLHKLWTGVWCVFPESRRPSVICCEAAAWKMNSENNTGFCSNWINKLLINNLKRLQGESFNLLVEFPTNKSCVFFHIKDQLPVQGVEPSWPLWRNDLLTALQRIKKAFRLLFSCLEWTRAVGKASWTGLNPSGNHQVILAVGKCRGCPSLSSSRGGWTSMERWIQQNHWGWKSPVRSLRPTINHDLLLWSILSFTPEYHLCEMSQQELCWLKCFTKNSAQTWSFQFMSAPLVLHVLFMGSKRS